ncbi:Regulator of G protein signaling domain family protein [Candida parapsilosis]|uniref:RGS domain-containing protein n=2 Tax=Candida parapsilosis TaxID=5480 RepID=G8BCX1_CANPC|nr:uncharacterized protein CPAR2_207590 [Candida parapsilosis]KAF6054733.1 Regulator of G protein signaling domain family protein [Candida parapsilosis]KAF6056241.1 Regulator of G protein signaling domain family protein [Candida parapsilosis]KAF6059174.1 Regulator of G protein signaling domain family protein [Candida parapsilosis]KAF6067931.1 Regulator of G protein signaling domain family protein [Candida parapsilosis]KAI5903608.1 hypothetical protein K4G60_g2763 [Candida parapsilosis]
MSQPRQQAPQQQQQQQQSQNATSISRATTPATIESTESSSPLPSTNQTLPSSLNPDQLPTSPVSISSSTSSSSSSAKAVSVSSSITNSPTPFNPLPTRSINFAALNSKIQQKQHHSHPHPHVNTQFPARNSPSSSVPTQTSTPNTMSPTHSSLPSRSQSPIVPPLHDLVNDCFLLTIDKLQDDTRAFIANSFHQCVAKQHCEENLEFLIDIYRYEYEYNLKVLTSSLNNASNSTTASTTNPPSLSTSLNSKAVINGFNHEEATSMAKMKLNAPSPCITPTTHGASTASLFRRHQKTSSVASFESLKKKHSIRSEELDPQQAFVSTIDDLDLNAPWDSFGESHVGEDEEYSDDEEDEEQPNTQDVAELLAKKDLQQLNERWLFIMNNYIKHDSPSQINISQKLFKEIVQESSVCKLHDPIILLKARNEVLQILKENCYSSFASKFKKQMAQPCGGQEGVCCSCGMEENKAGNYRALSPSMNNNNDSMLTLEGIVTGDSTATTTSCNECREIPSSSTTSTMTTSSMFTPGADKSQQPHRHHHLYHHHHYHHHHSRNQDSPNMSSSSSIAASLLGKLSLPKRSKTVKHPDPQVQQQNGNITSPLYGELSPPSSNSSSMSNIFGNAKFALGSSGAGAGGDASPSPSSVASSTRGIPISSPSVRKQQPATIQQTPTAMVTPAQGTTNASTSATPLQAQSLPIPRSSNGSPISLNSVVSNAQKDRDRDRDREGGPPVSSTGSLSSSLKFWKRK